MRLLCVLLAWSPLLMATMPHTDGFDAGSTLAGSWTQRGGSWTVSGSVARIVNNPSATVFAWWNADTFTGDQSAEGVIASTPNSAKFQYVGVKVKNAGGSSVDGYFLEWSSSNPTIVRVTNGVSTTLATCFLIGELSGVAMGDAFKLAIVGTTLTGYKNGTPINSCEATDSTFTTGAPGIGEYNSSGTSTGFSSVTLTGTASVGGGGDTVPQQITVVSSD